jgi:hypothetical protein
MKMFFLFCFVTVLTIIYSGCSRQNNSNNWKIFSSEEGGFSVLFPSSPKEEVKNTKPFPAHLFIYKLNETTSYVIIYSDVPPTPDTR